MTDWTILGGDPAPGDTAQISFRLSHLKRAEEAIREVHDELGRIARGTEDAAWQGEAAECMRDALDAFRYDLEPIADSFLGVRNSLKSYNTELEDLQARARQALRRATAAAAQKDRAEDDHAAASSVLGQQRSQLQSNKAAERRHALSSTVQNAVDPGASATNAEEARRLARETYRAQQAADETDRKVQRLSAEIQAAQADLDGARREAGRIHEEWDEDSKRAATNVEDALADELRNKSWLEKAASKIASEIGDIVRFMQDPLHNLSVLRKWLDRLHELYSMVATVLTIAAIFAGAIGLGPLAAALIVLATAAAAVALVLSLGKLILDAVLYSNGYTEDGKTVVTKGDLIMGGVTVVFDIIALVPLVGKSAKIAKAPLISSRYIAPGTEKAVVNAARRRVATEGIKYVRDKRRDELIDDVVRKVFDPPKTKHVKVGPCVVLKKLDGGPVRPTPIGVR